MENFFKRFTEPSTWRGLAVLAGLLGVNVAPEAQGAIVNVVGGLYALINIFRKEK